MHRIVNSYRDAYKKSSRSDKTILVRAAIQDIKEGGARFLKRYDVASTEEGAAVYNATSTSSHSSHNDDDENKDDDLWVEVEDDAVYEKISHALRGNGSNRRDPQLVATTTQTSASGSAPRRRQSNSKSANQHHQNQNIKSLQEPLTVPPGVGNLLREQNAMNQAPALPAASTAASVSLLPVNPLLGLLLQGNVKVDPTLPGPLLNQSIQESTAAAATAAAVGQALAANSSQPSAPHQYNEQQLLLKALLLGSQQQQQASAAIGRLLGTVSAPSLSPPAAATLNLSSLPGLTVPRSLGAWPQSSSSEFIGNSSTNPLSSLLQSSGSDVAALVELLRRQQLLSPLQQQQELHHGQESALQALMPGLLGVGGNSINGISLESLLGGSSNHNHQQQSSTVDERSLALALLLAQQPSLSNSSSGLPALAPSSTAAAPLSSSQPSSP
jgi:hypothetical protein